MRSCHTNVTSAASVVYPTYNFVSAAWKDKSDRHLFMLDNRGNLDVHTLLNK